MAVKEARWATLLANRKSADLRYCFFGVGPVSRSTNIL